MFEKRVGVSCICPLRVVCVLLLFLIRGCFSVGGRYLVYVPFETTLPSLSHELAGDNRPCWYSKWRPQPYPWWCFTPPKPWKQQKIIHDHHRKNSFWCPENPTMSRTLQGARLIILLWGTVKICRSVIWNQVSARREERECGVNSNLRGIFSKKRQTSQTCSNKISAAETTNSSTVIVSLLAPFFINACKMRETIIN